MRPGRQGDHRQVEMRGELEPSKMLQESIRKFDVQHRQRQLPSMTQPMPASSNFDTPHSVPSQEPSMLATFIWKGQWEAVSQRLVTHPQEAQQKIRLPAFSNSDISIKALPFHLACARRPLPPTEVMKDLMASYLGACKQPTGSPLGLLPLHLVADLSNIEYNGDPKDAASRKVHMALPSKVPQSSNHADIVSMLLQKFPESVLLPEPTNEMLPLHVAAATFKVENNADSDETSIPVQVIEMLVDAGPPQVATRLRDRNGLTPMDWAWRNAQLACPTCNKIMNYSYDTVKDFHPICGCPDQQSSHKHPMLQSVIRSHLMTIHPTIRETEHGFMPSTIPVVQKNVFPNKKAESVIRCDRGKETFHSAAKHRLREARDDASWIKDRHAIGKTTSEERDAPRHLIRDESLKDASQHTSSIQAGNLTKSGSSPDLMKSPVSGIASSKMYYKALESRNIRTKFKSQALKESQPTKTAEFGTGSVRATAVNNGSLSSQEEEPTRDDRNAVLCLKLRLSDLLHPCRSNIGSPTGNGRGGSSPQRSFSNAFNPNPCFEIFVAHRAGLSDGYYKSYPMYNVRDGTWEEAFIDTGLTRHQLQCGIDGASHVEIGIRVMHCPSKGSEMKLIGITQISLETLELNANRRIQGGTSIHHSSNNNKFPILQGYQVMGWLQVLSFRIK
ncbi:hypothetical protein IV203_018760 [Nitzschia inconspicua]|uniref:Uncharacterized protein n=1 Tax=Nitzschia inconspicua TaxID=303405 RepID=A0A9K3M296_9STRA|nr:hypothetical protein IV203_018760 [Nitzschia inconspicua]